MVNHSAEVAPSLSSKPMVRGIQGFILFSVLGIMLGLWWKRPASLEVLFSHLHWKFIALLVPLIVLDYFLGGLRYRLFFDGMILPHVSLWNCMRSNWANIFMGAVTPFQTGGGPAQLYILWRCGAKISDGVLISLINFVATLLFFLTATIVAALLLPANLFGENFATVLQTGFVVIGAITALMLVVLFFPTLGVTMVRQLFRSIPLRSPRFHAFRDRMLNTLDAETHRFGDAFGQILRRRKWLLAGVTLATLLLFVNKYVMGYVIARSLAQPVPFRIFVGLQIVQLFLIYFAPTPGASGVAELSSVWLMGELMPETVLLVYAVAWRFATTILGATIGGVVLLLDMRYWLPGRAGQRAMPAESAKAVAP